MKKGQHLIGYLVKITKLKDEPQPSALNYIGKTGEIKQVTYGLNGEPMYWGDWGGIALFDGEFEIIGRLSLND